MPILKWVSLTMTLLILGDPAFVHHIVFALVDQLSCVVVAAHALQTLKHLEVVFGDLVEFHHSLGVVQRWDYFVRLVIEGMLAWRL